MLTGCGGSHPPIGAPGTMPQTSAIAQHAAHGKSWMLPEAKGENLLYIADYGGGVIVYAYRPARLKYVGYLAAPLYAQGECVDKEQNVFITASNYEIYEYAHAATSAKAVLTDPFANPNNCASDPATGNLAVVGFSFYNYDQGVAIFKKARGKPKLYPDSGFGWACSYDQQGNLFIDGGGVRNGYIKFAELPKGGTTFSNISLNQTFNEAGGVQWDGHNVAVGDYYNAIIYKFRISGSTGTEVGSTPLTASGTVLQFFIDKVRGKVLVPSTFQDAPGFVNIYNYPQGGTAGRTLNFGNPDGVAVSLAGRKPMRHGR
jgi:hypothetical protein